VYVELVQIHKQTKIQETCGVEDRHSTSRIPDGNQLAASQFYIYYQIFSITTSSQSTSGCKRWMPTPIINLYTSWCTFVDYL